MTDKQTVFAVAMLLFLTWLGLIIWPQPNSGEMIGFIKGVLLSIGAHHLTAWQPQQSAVVNNVTSSQEGKKE